MKNKIFVFIIIGMISAMKKCSYIYIVLFTISGLILSSCMLQANPRSEFSTVTAEIELAVSTPTLAPKITATKEDSLSEQIPVGTKITFWHPWSGEMANLIDEMVGEFNESNKWGIWVDPEFHSDEAVFIDDMNRAILDGNPPDIIASPDDYLKYLDETGFKLQDLQNYIASPKWGIPKDEIESFLPVFWNTNFTSGKRLSVPAYQSGYFIFFNQTWAKELGFSQPPSSPEEFKNQTCKAGSSYLNDNDLNNNGTGGWVYSVNPLTFFSWLRAFGGGGEGEENILNDLGLSAKHRRRLLFI